MGFVSHKSCVIPRWMRSTFVLSPTMAATYRRRRWLHNGEKEGDIAERRREGGREGGVLWRRRPRAGWPRIASFTSRSAPSFQIQLLLSPIALSCMHSFGISRAVVPGFQGRLYRKEIISRCRRAKDFPFSGGQCSRHRGDVLEALWEHIFPISLIVSPVAPSPQSE